jgi:hypothetical protein
MVVYDDTWIYFSGKIIDSLVLCLFTIGLVGLGFKAKFKIDTSAIIVFGIQLVCTILRVISDY